MDDDRLIDSMRQIHEIIHTVEGLHAFDAPRRTMVDMGIKSLKIHRELDKRGHRVRCCRVAERALA